MLNICGNALIFFFKYTAAGAGKTGLSDVTVDVYRNRVKIVTAAAATELAKGVYYYTLAAASVTAAGDYLAQASTADSTVDQQDVDAMWQIFGSLDLTSATEGDVIELDETLAGLLLLLRTRMNDLKIGIFTDTELKRCVLLAYRETVMATKCNKQTVQISVTAGRIGKVALAPTVGGSGYAIGDILTVSGGTAGTVEVVGVASGVVTAVRLYAAGSGYTTGSGKATTGGTGTSCTIKIDALAPVWTVSTHTYDISPLFEAFEVSIDDVQLRRASMQEQATAVLDWNNTAAGTPECWMPVTGSQVRIYPAPDAAAISSGVLRVHGFAKPSDLLRATDTPDAIPTGFAAPTILDRATAEACSMRKYTAQNAAFYKDYMSRWSDWCEKIKSSVKGDGR